LDERPQDDFGIAMTVEAVAERFQFCPDLFMVINFTVEDDGRIAILSYHGLAAAFEINDPKADSPKANVWRRENALLVGPAMR
jgi:hypothetical protein